VPIPRLYKLAQSLAAIFLLNFQIQLGQLTVYPKWTLLLTSYDLLLIGLVSYWGSSLIRSMLAVVLTLHGSYGFAKNLYLFYYNRSMEFSQDISLISGFLSYLNATYGWTASFMTAGLGCGILILLIFINYRLLRHLGDRLKRFSLTRTQATTLTIAIGLSIWLHGAIGSSTKLPTRSPLHAEIKHIQSSFEDQSRHQTFRKKLAAKRQRINTGLPPASRFRQAVREHNIFLIVVESYGITAHDPSALPWLRRHLSSLSKRLEQYGYSAHSRYLRSPVYGGFSWFADASLSCGLNITSRYEYRALFRTATPCLSHYMNANHYLTFDLRPGTSTLFPEAKGFFGFAQSFHRSQIAYDGPAYGFAGVPDEYAINYAIKELNETFPNQLLYGEMILTSSHLPWQRVPPVINNVAELLRNEGQTYHLKPAQSYATIKEAYSQAIAYDFEIILDLIANDDAGRPILMIVGDHQPSSNWGTMAKSQMVPFHLFVPDELQLPRHCRNELKSGMLGAMDSKDDFSWLLPHLVTCFTHPHTAARQLQTIH
jgi:hypothetical protein